MKKLFVNFRVNLKQYFIWNWKQETRFVKLIVEIGRIKIVKWYF